MSFDKNHVRGRHAEEVVSVLLKKKGYWIVYRNIKTDIAEIDLLAMNSRKVILLEVKTLDNEWRAFERVSIKQLQNLRRNLVRFQGFQKRNPEFEFGVFVALVNKLNQVRIIDVSRV